MVVLLFLLYKRKKKKKNLLYYYYYYYYYIGGHHGLLSVSLFIIYLFIFLAALLPDLFCLLKTFKVSDEVRMHDSDNLGASLLASHEEPRALSCHFIFKQLSKFSSCLLQFSLQRLRCFSFREAYSS